MVIIHSVHRYTHTHTHTHSLSLTHTWSCGRHRGERVGSVTMVNVLRYDNPVSAQVQFLSLVLYRMCRTKLERTSFIFVFII